MKSPRLCAFEILDRVIRNNAYSNIALDKSATELSPADRAFVFQLVYGVIERKLTLDYIINKNLTSRTKPKVKILLYLGAYQLYFTDKIPASAAINETVKLCNEVGLSYYKGLVNAVLRSIDKDRIDIESLDDSIKYSCPENLINMWTKQYGSDNTEKILKSLNTVPPVFAVPNALYLDSDELVYELALENIESENARDIVKVISPLNVSKSKAFESGLYHIEDLSSFECVKALGVEAGDTVIDVCSAPGGKAFTAAELMNNNGKLYAFDLHEHRVKLIADGAKRLGLTCVTAQVNDASVFNPDLPKADKVLCDVPCSGFGVIRRKPEIRYKELDSVKELPELQYSILTVSSKYVKSGGRIMYSTCTLNKKENEAVVERFLNDNGSFALKSMKTVFPDTDGGDGFFYALMEKTDD